MPLLDHFRPPVSTRYPFDSFLSNWATRIADDLNERWLGPGFLAHEVTISGIRLAADLATSEMDTAASSWSPPPPSASVPVELTDCYEVRGRTTGDEPELVGVVELISPINKGSIAGRAALAARCANYLLGGVSVVMIDIATTGRSNLHSELMKLVGLSAETSAADDSPLYAVSYRAVARGERTRLDVWYETCAVAEPLPTQPLHLVHDLFVPIEFEATYMEACRKRRLA